MKEFVGLSPQGNLRRLRELANAALGSYGVRPTRMTMLAHMENATFRVDAADGERYVPRVQREGGSPLHPVRTEAGVRSEMEWLAALRRETDLAGHERYIETFHGLRVILPMLWFYERRDRPGFEDWGQEMREGLVALESFVPAEG